MQPCDNLLLLEYGVLICSKSFAFQRSSEWLTEKSLFTSGARICPHNAKVRRYIVITSNVKSLWNVSSAHEYFSVDETRTDCRYNPPLRCSTTLVK